MTTRLDAMWHAVDATADDDEAIAIVERERHAGCGTDERGMTMTRFSPTTSAPRGGLAWTGEPTESDVRSH
jgi:hypothetical protein